MLEGVSPGLARIVAAIVATLLLAVAGPAWAVDGVLEINQTCAVQTGCFTGDAAGFPVEIDQPGSYRLTTELSAGGTAIDVSAEYVTLDLNGFRIAGSGGGGSYGVHATQIGPGPDYVTVRNGSITGFETGIGVESFGRIERLSISQCTTGISVGPDTTVRDSTISENGGTGIAGPARIQGTVLASNPVNLSGAFSNMGGNFCDGSRCPHERRRYYITTSGFDGAQAPTACATGFHMANIHEIWDTAELEYDTSLGKTLLDSGLGPPISWGWVRTGGASTLQNCSAYTSNTYGTEGVIAYRIGADAFQLLDGSVPWTDDGTIPWGFLPTPCNFTEYVWCVED